MNRRQRVEIRHFHLFCGIGGGARGFNAGQARVGSLEANFRCLGGIDNDPAAVDDFRKLTGVKGAVMDLFSRAQYEAWHEAPPPEDWVEVTPADVRAVAGDERPHIVFTSSPCKGLSGLLPEKRSGSPRYQALNELTLRGVWLTLEAWQDDPPEFVLFENVPRIQNRGSALLEKIEALLESYGYAVARTTHDCGEIGGLAQSRKRFLLVARHREKVPPFLYEPPKRRLRGVGEVLSALPMPGDEAAGPMHSLRRLQWKTWVRLALVEAGGDWRSLERLKVENGQLADLCLMPEQGYYAGAYGVVGWEDNAGTVTGNGRPASGRFSVADPRTGFSGDYGQYGVKGWHETSGTVTGKAGPGSGRYSVADPRVPGVGYGAYGVCRWDQAAPTITSQRSPGQGRFSVSDPRIGDKGARFNNVYRVVRWEDASPAVTAGGGPTSGGISVADPRMAWGATRQNYQTGGHYGVVNWQDSSGSVTASAKHDRGYFSVADPRVIGVSQPVEQPAPEDRGVFVILSEDNTWHRPFTTMELAALQGLVDPDSLITFTGQADGAWRERIGNAVPSQAAAAIASVMGQTLLLAWTGQSQLLSSTPVWVQPFLASLSVDPMHIGDGI
ncbi:DNA cytosine methyltransferase [Salinisphaera sp. P385]|uniref:DNA (cytosine-5-)-methyltransferase n=1 Tax=Spectribacter acetivorans TaxID=3075603 RepID=A0ABU3B8I4_9GAMM|nr:DNA cytosine methyltransferase [Salinisphaera sp. P385]MDT0618483.1 DNA cytosine methyltransferase [Salinisphaera sp. P385]